MTVTTGCFKILNSTLKYVCFTMISTFNLTPLASGMTGRDGRKTLRFYWLVWLVASCHSLLVLKYKEIILFHVPTCTFQQPLWSVVLVVTCYSWIAFCFLWTFLMFDFAVGQWVCVDFYLVSSFLPYRELVRLVSVVVPQLNAFVCTFGS